MRFVALLAVKITIFQDVCRVDLYEDTNVSDKRAVSNHQDFTTPKNRRQLCFLHSLLFSFGLLRFRIYSEKTYRLYFRAIPGEWSVLYHVAGWQKTYIRAPDSSWQAEDCAWLQTQLRLWGSRVVPVIKILRTFWFLRPNVKSSTSVSSFACIQ